MYIFEWYCKDLVFISNVLEFVSLASSCRVSVSSNRSSTNACSTSSSSSLTRRERISSFSILSKLSNGLCPSKQTNTTNCYRNTSDFRRQLTSNLRLNRPRSTISKWVGTEKSRTLVDAQEIRITRRMKIAQKASRKSSPKPSIGTIVKPRIKIKIKIEICYVKTCTQKYKQRSDYIQ